MQLLRKEIKSKVAEGDLSALSDGCAEAVLDVAPPVVRAIRRMMREHRLPDLSVPQFRALALLSYSTDACLSTVADFIGSSMPATSRMIDGMVAKNLIARKQCCRDRRQVALELTPMGRDAFLESRQATRLQLARRLAGLSPKKREGVIEAMKYLGEIFGSDAEAAAQASRKSSGENS